MQDRPDLEELLEAVSAFLREDVLPGQDGRPRYHLLVALNLLKMASREWRLGPEQLHDEWTRLRALPLPPLEDDPPTEFHRAAEALRQANETLCGDIQAGRYDDGPGRESLLAHLRATLAARLRIANPDFLERVSGAPPAGRR